MILVQVTDFIGPYALANAAATNGILQAYIDEQEKKTLYHLLGKELADLLITYIASFITAGPLVIGTEYVIAEYKAGDDFTNVGATSNATGTVFTATGTAPTVYTKGSKLRATVARYETLLNPFYLETSDTDSSDFYYVCETKFHESFGIHELLKIQIYYTYLSQEQILPSQSGVVSQSVENGNVQSPQQAFRMGERKWNTRGLDTWEAIYWLCKYKYPLTYPEWKGRTEKPRYSAII